MIVYACFFFFLCVACAFGIHRYIKTKDFFDLLNSILCFFGALACMAGGLLYPLINK